ncbi:flavin reductase family protein [Mesobacterium sp. TK19101]|uniref:Flavin reductase family protein n=1 Tax=Mesobacterium hydrothermale TaxID=3111907 RepID=A0ABU6HL15_9RHOB|nr:flavin reductase family protein [Mesobacterium sp. TK19101]MEC3863148.1 flavin reductase family protein [Mesobacterium sp. TK19101]
MQFTPGQDTAQQFRAALGRFATGVTVVTCLSKDGPLGITANSFASVSLDPPLVLWSPARTSRRFEAFAGAEHFSIHILADDQGHIGHGFARKGHAFHDGDWSETDMGVPVLDTCLARFDCQKFAIHDAGDHAIIVGRVIQAMARQGNPLVFAKGVYGGFTNKD